MNEICTHCASPITHTRLEDPTGIYCCHACQTVADLLRSEALDENYRHLLSLNQSKPKKASGDLESLISALENQDHWKEIGTWRGDVHCLDFSSPQIHCAACGWLLEKALGSLPGIAALRVDFSRGQMHLEYRPELVNLGLIMRRALSFGYKIHPLDGMENPTEDLMEKGLLLRLSVAAFALMNVMTFTFAAYLEHFSSLREWTPLMNLWALILTIPVMVYSATPFYTRAWAGLRARVLHMDLPVSLGIIFSFVASVLLWLEERPVYFDTAAGVVFFLLIGRWWVQRFERGLLGRGEWLGQLLPEKIRKSEGDSWIACLPHQLLPGDLIRLGAGELVPAQGLLRSQSAVGFDPQWMTGESRLVRVQPGEVVPSGYLCNTESEIELTETLNQSEFHALRQKWRAQEKSTPAHRAEKLVPYFTGIILILATVAAWLARDQGLIKAFEQAALVLILSCPCALALARPASEGLALSRARQNGYLLRNSQTLENIESITTVVLDKTGTLTAHQRNISQWQWIQQSDLHRDLIAQCAKRSLHPASRALALELQVTQDAIFEVLFEQEIEHLGIRTDIRHQNQNYQVWICRAWINADETQQLGIDSTMDPDLLRSWDSMALVNGQIVALMRFSEEILPGAHEMIRTLQKSGRKVHLYSGDRLDRVQKLADQLGVDLALGAMTPFDKGNRIQELRQQGEKVLTAGDGFNDALMLGQAHLAALAWGGSKSLGGQAEILALRGDWSGFASLFALAKRRRNAEWAGYTLSLIYNAGAIGLAFSGVLPPLVGAIAMPISSLSVGFATWIFLRK